MTRNKPYTPADRANDELLPEVSEISHPGRKEANSREFRKVFSITGEERKEALDTFISNIEHGYMITLELGQPPNRLYVSVLRRALTGISPSFEEFIWEHSITDDGGHQSLRLPDDDVEAWKILLYTQFARSLPHMFCTADHSGAEPTAHEALLMQCWLLGDKYGAVQFQDLIMTELIEWTARRPVFPETIVFAALQAEPGSKLWEFVVEEEAVRLARHARPGETSTVAKDVARDDLPQAFVDAVYQTKFEDIVWGRDRLGSWEACMRFMLDGGPDNRWLNVPVPFNPGCHAEPQEDWGSDYDGSELGEAAVEDELLVKVDELSVDA